MPRKTFDSSEYHKSREAFNGHCLACGKWIGIHDRIKEHRARKSPHWHQEKEWVEEYNSGIPNGFPNKRLCCDGSCEALFIKRTIKDWAKIREEVLHRDHYTCQDCGRGPTREIKLKFSCRGNARLSNVKSLKTDDVKWWWKFEGRREEERLRDDLEVHHIIPISEGGAEFDLDNLTTLCFDCHHLGRHGSKAPTPEEKTRLRAELRQKAEADRIEAARSQHISFDKFQEVSA